MAAEQQIDWAHCNDCNRNTRHRVLHREHVVLEDQIADHISITWWDNYKLLQCLGCESVHLRHESSFSENKGPDGGLEITTTIYPPRTSRSKPEWLGNISGPFWGGAHDIEQIYVALHNDSLRLAAMGIRALIEFIVIDKVGDRGSFGENIKAFFGAGYVAAVDREIFKSKLIEAGHAAMHRGYRPDATDLGTLLDLTESLIASVYVHPARAKGLEKRIPARRSAKLGPKPT
jgi:hypothetical protein